jgi:hypothetical protein
VTLSARAGIHRTGSNQTEVEPAMEWGSSLSRVIDCAITMLYNINPAVFFWPT